MTGEILEQRKCECHGEEMSWTNDARYRAGGYHRCREHMRVRARARYAIRPNGLWYNRDLLKNRRHKAKVRRREREATA